MKPKSCILVRPQGFVRAAAEGGLELTAEILAIGMAQQEFRQRMGVRRHVERFVRADAGVGAGGHVAHGVAAGFARGDADGGQAPHHAGRVLDVHVVKLKVLARGDVGDAVGVFLGQFGHGFQLRGVQPAGGDLDALHARGVPHGVRALGQVAGGIGHLLHFLPSWRWPLS